MEAKRALIPRRVAIFPFEADRQRENAFSATFYRIVPRVLIENDNENT